MNIVAGCLECINEILQHPESAQWKVKTDLIRSDENIIECLYCRGEEKEWFHTQFDAIWCACRCMSPSNTERSYSNNATLPWRSTPIHISIRRCYVSFQSRRRWHLVLVHSWRKVQSITDRTMFLSTYACFKATRSVGPWPATHRQKIMASQPMRDSFKPGLGLLING